MAKKCKLIPGLPLPFFEEKEPSPGVDVPERPKVRPDIIIIDPPPKPPVNPKNPGGEQEEVLYKCLCKGSPEPTYISKTSPGIVNKELPGGFKVKFECYTETHQLDYGCVTTDADEPPFPDPINGIVQDFWDSKSNFPYWTESVNVSKQSEEDCGGTGPINELQCGVCSPSNILVEKCKNIPDSPPTGGWGGGYPGGATGGGNPNRVCSCSWNQIFYPAGSNELLNGCVEKTFIANYDCNKETKPFLSISKVKKFGESLLKEGEFLKDYTIEDGGSSSQAPDCGLSQENSCVGACFSIPVKIKICKKTTSSPTTGELDECGCSYSDPKLVSKKKILLKKCMEYSFKIDAECKNINSSNFKDFTEDDWKEFAENYGKGKFTSDINISFKSSTCGGNNCLGQCGGAESSFIICDNISDGPTTGGPPIGGGPSVPGGSTGGPITGGPSVPGGGPAAPSQCVPFGTPERTLEKLSTTGGGGDFFLGTGDKGTVCYLETIKIPQLCVSPLEAGELKNDPRVKNLIKQADKLKEKAEKFPQASIVNDYGEFGCNANDGCEPFVFSSISCYQGEIDPDPEDQPGGGGLGAGGGGLGAGGGGGLGAGGNAGKSGSYPNKASQKPKFPSTFNSKEEADAYFSNYTILNSHKINIAKQQASIINNLKSSFTSLTSHFNIKKVIDLFSDPEESNKYSIVDPETSIETSKPENNKRFVKNSKYKNIFTNYVHDSIKKINDINGTFSDWDSKSVYQLSTDYILGSLSNKFFESANKILKLDGTYLTKEEISSIVRSRLINNNLDLFDVSSLDYLSNATKVYEKPLLQTSKEKVLNEIALISFIKDGLVPLSGEGPFGKRVMENWKTFATDLDKYVEVDFGPYVGKYYINDDDRAVDNARLEISDGDVLKLKYGTVSKNIPVKSKKDRAYILLEEYRQQALSILGGSKERTIYAQVDASSDVEFNYSLNLENDSPRQEAYVFKLIPSATVKETKSDISDFIVETNGKYQLMDSTTEAGINEINEYIKYKYNHRTIFLSHDDLLFDYIENTSSINMIQQDFIIPQAKDNENLPLIARDYPWYIIIVPTNRADYMLFDNKSNIVSYSTEGKIRRDIKVTPALDPKFSRQGLATVFTETYTENNVYNSKGDVDPGAFTTVFSTSAPVYDSLYYNGDNYGRPSEIGLLREKTTFRLFKEIIDELDSNYVLGTNTRNKSLNAFDLISRLSQLEFNKFVSFENSNYLYNLIKNGLFKGVRIQPTINYGNQKISNRDDAALKTKFVRKRGTAASSDKFPVIKSTNLGRFIEPPSFEILSSSFRDRNRLLQSSIESDAKSSRIN